MHRFGGDMFIDLIHSKKINLKSLPKSSDFFKMSEQNNQTEVPTQENEELKAELTKLEDEINTLKQVSIKFHQVFEHQNFFLSSKREN